MGCGGSKLEAGADAAEGLRTMRRRVEDIRRRRFGSGARIRKDSIVSTTGLLHPDEEEEDAATATTDEASHGGSLRVDHVCRVCGATSPPPADNSRDPQSSSTMVTPPPAVEVERATGEEAEVAAVAPGAAGVTELDGAVRKPEEKREKEKDDKEKEGEEKQEKEKEEEEDEKNEGGREEKAAEENKKDENEGEKRTVGGSALLSGGGSRYDEEELPGSPSFRVYFEGSVTESTDDDSVNASTAEAAGKADGKERPGRNDSIDSCNSEESEGKTSKKHRVKRFKALTRGPSAVYGLLNVRSCYSHNGNNTNSSSHENPHSAHSLLSVRSCYNHSNSSSNNNNSIPNENPSLLSEKVA